MSQPENWKQLWARKLASKSENLRTVGREAIIPNPKASLMEQVREVMRFHHYSIHTERSYGLFVSSKFKVQSSKAKGWGRRTSRGKRRRTSNIQLPPSNV